MYMPEIKFGILIFGTKHGGPVKHVRGRAGEENIFLHHGPRVVVVSDDGARE